MTKIIIYPQQIIPERKVVVRSCKECPFCVSLYGEIGFWNAFSTKQSLFCIEHGQDIKKVKAYNKANRKNKHHIAKTLSDKSKSYAFIKNPEQVPEWCMLPNLESYIGTCKNCGYEAKYPVCTKCGALFLSEKYDGKE